VATLIYVDESGDLGWSLDKPYGHGGSSRFLTIAAVIVPESLDHMPQRKVRQLYKHGKWDTKREKKWVEMPSASRTNFANNAKNLVETHPILYKAIVAKKANVNESFRRDSNKLYNYMLRLLLLELMAQYEEVTLIPDPRSIKVENGKSLHHYLEMLLYEIEAPTKLTTSVRDSKNCLNLQFVDMLAGVIGTHYESNNSSFWNILSSRIEIRRLFF
jgi:hypothetical protein